MMDAKFKITGLAAAIAMALAGCGGGGSDGTNDTTGDTTDNIVDVANAVAGSLNEDNEVVSALTRGFSLPSEISAVPTEEDTSTRSFSRSLRGFTRAPSDLPSTSDYSEARVNRYVEERALEQFDIIEEVLGALAQTNYADPEVINLGPYKAMVSFLDDQDGRDVKTLEPWVVDSRLIVVDGNDVNRVLAWIEEPDYENPGQTRMIKAEFKIYGAATANADGSLADYGSWDLNVSFDETGTSFFVASSRVNAGETTIMINESQTRFENFGTGTPTEVTTASRGILVRGADAGYGQVSYPDWEACWGMTGSTGACDSGIPTKQASYAYNADYLAVKDNGDETDFKDRDPANSVEMVHRYGLFHNETPPTGVTAGDNAEKHVQFGFPLSIPVLDETDQVVQGANDFAYYGAWQGRHEIWGGRDGSGLPAGLTVHRGDHFDPDTTPEAFTTSELFNGTLTKRALADGSLNDILNIQVETHMNKRWDLNWDETAGLWKSCDGWMDWQWDEFGNETKTCRDFAGNAIPVTEFTEFDMLAPDESGRKWVNIGSWDETANSGMGGHVDLVYQGDPDNNPATDDGDFYVGMWVDGEYGQQLEATTTAFNPADGSNMWVDVSGSIYIQYTGDFTGGNVGWVQKELLDFDMESYQPEFGTNDLPFDPEMGREYYINNNGANFIVKRIAEVNEAADYSVKIELQSAANPVNIATILPTGTAYLATPWRPEVQFDFITNTENTHFMKLVYATDDPNTDGDETGTVYTNGEWGLHAYNSSDQPLLADGTVVAVNEWGDPVNEADGRPTQFNWEYSEGGWGSQQFLIDGNGDFVILSDPIALDPITVDHDGGTKNLSLQFDGWLHGLPDMYRLLAENDWVMNADIASKVVSIPEGTAASSGGVGYYIKPLDVSVFLSVVDGSAIPTESVPDIDLGIAVNLNAVPTYVPHGMGLIPQDVEMRYSEGLPVDAE